MTCDCACPQSEVACGQPGSERCVSTQCSGGRIFNPATCTCECPPTQPIACGGQCRAECRTGQLRDPVTCQCVNARSGANCEGCCGTSSSGSGICRAGTTNTNCGTAGGECLPCSSPATCNPLPSGGGRCCVANGTNPGSPCVMCRNAACCSGNCSPGNGRCVA